MQSPNAVTAMLEVHCPYCQAWNSVNYIDRPVYIYCSNCPKRFGVMGNGETFKTLILNQEKGDG